MTVKYLLKRLKITPVTPEYHKLIEGTDKAYLSELGLQYNKGITFIEAGTGLGKTEEALTYEDKTKHINLSVPLISMLINKKGSGKYDHIPTHYEHGEQIYGGYKTGVFADMLMMGGTTMGTYDSHIHMSDNLMNNTIAFYDEFTYASMSQGFRERVAPQFQRLWDEGFSLVMMSGTVYKESIIPFVDRYIVVEKEGAQKRKATIIANEEGMDKRGFMLRAIHDGYNKNELIVAFVESTEDIDSLKNSLKLPKNEVISFISEESDHTAGNTPKAREMMRTGTIPKGTRVLLWTSAAIVGADLRHAEGKIPVKILFHSGYDAKPESVAQMSGRFRDIKEIECFIGCSEHWYKKHFEDSKGYDKKIAHRQLIGILNRGMEYHSSNGTFKGYDHAHLFLEKNVNLLGVMEWITQQVRTYTCWKTLYRNFNINIEQVVKLNVEMKPSEKASFLDAENRILKMSENIDFDKIDEALVIFDNDIKIKKLPQPIQSLIRMSNVANVKAKPRLTKIVKARKIYNNPYEWRCSHMEIDEDKGIMKYPALSTMINTPPELLAEWNSHRRLRKKCLTVLGHKEWHSVKTIVKELRNMYSGERQPFSTSKEKNKLIAELTKSRARVESTLKKFLNIEVKQIGKKKTKMYKLNLGLPPYASDYNIDWVEEEYEEFYKDGGYQARYEVIVSHFEDLDCA